MGRPEVRTITKRELTERLATKTGESRTAIKRIMEEYFAEVMTELAAGNRIEFRDFGVFEVKVRAPRTAQNPRTLERVRVPERRSVKFKPGRKMRDIVENGADSDAGAPPPPPLREPKGGIRPDTDGYGQRIDAPARMDGKARQTF